MWSALIRTFALYQDILHDICHEKKIKFWFKTPAYVAHLHTHTNTHTHTHMQIQALNHTVNPRRCHLALYVLVTWFGSGCC